MKAVIVALLDLHGHGGADFISDANEHAYVRDMINSYHPGRAEYLEFPKTDHFFLRAEDEADAYKVITEGVADREFNADILDALADFCERAVGN